MAVLALAAPLHVGFYAARWLARDAKKPPIPARAQCIESRRSKCRCGTAHADRGDPTNETCARVMFVFVVAKAQYSCTRRCDVVTSSVPSWPFVQEECGQELLLRRRTPLSERAQAKSRCGKVPKSQSMCVSPRLDLPTAQPQDGCRELTPFAGTLSLLSLSTREAIEYPRQCRVAAVLVSRSE